MRIQRYERRRKRMMTMSVYACWERDGRGAGEGWWAMVRESE
jgi:hypothetical protein